MLLKSVSIVALLSLGSVSFSAAAAWAEDHIIIILGSAYFPQKTAVSEGDVVRFVNVSGFDHTILQTGGTWATLEIADGEELLLTIEQGMTGPFHGQAKTLITGQFEKLRQPITN